MGLLARFREIGFTQGFNYYLGFVSFIFCVAPKWVSPCVLGLLIFVVIGYIKRELIFKISTPALFMILLYLTYVIGVLFTNHPDIAGKYLEYKLSLILFPLLLSFRFRQSMSLIPSVVGLILGVTTASFMGLYHSYWLYQSVGDFNNSFGSVRFSYIHHPSYFSVFHTIAIVGFWFGVSKKWKGFHWAIGILFTLFSLIMQFFCFSLAGMLFLFLLGLVVYLVLSYRYFKKWLFYLSLIAIPVVPFVLYKSNIHIRIEVDGAFAVVDQFTNNPVEFIRQKKNTAVGSEIRVIMWIVAYQEMKAHPFGVGTGNVDDYLSKRLVEYDQKEIASHLYNPHNQFLQTGLEIGLLGLGILVLMITSTFRFAMKNKNWILLILIASLVFNSLFESMLQRQSGIVFYSFWICLLIVYSNTKAFVDQKNSN